MSTETLFQAWARRTPSWEKKYEDTLIKPYSDYGRGASQFNEDRGKIFGGGYEVFIIAFFYGLYCDARKPLSTDASKKKNFGFPISAWGNLENRNKRTSYAGLRDFMFAALVAKTDIDFIALDKGEIALKDAVDALMKTMEEYANAGFRHMEELVDENPNYFYKEGAFLKLFLPFIGIGEDENEEGEEPEELV